MSTPDKSTVTPTHTPAAILPSGLVVNSSIARACPLRLPHKVSPHAQEHQLRPRATHPSTHLRRPEAKRFLPRPPLTDFETHTDRRRHHQPGRSPRKCKGALTAQPRGPPLTRADPSSTSCRVPCPLSLPLLLTLRVPPLPLLLLLDASLRSFFLFSLVRRLAPSLTKIAIFPQIFP